jgi:hypothetical protein
MTQEPEKASIYPDHLRKFANKPIVEKMQPFLDSPDTIVKNNLKKAAQLIGESEKTKQKLTNTNRELIISACVCAFAIILSAKMFPEFANFCCIPVEAMAIILYILEKFGKRRLRKSEAQFTQQTIEHHLENAGVPLENSQELQECMDYLHAWFLQQKHEETLKNLSKQL